MFEVVKIKAYSEPVFDERLIRLYLSTEKAARAFLATSFAIVVFS